MSRPWRDTTHHPDSGVCGERTCAIGSCKHKHDPALARFLMLLETLTTCLDSQRRVRRKPSPEAARVPYPAFVASPFRRHVPMRR
jgi:hypothetical protein